MPNWCWIIYSIVFANVSDTDASFFESFFHLLTVFYSFECDEIDSIFFFWNKISLGIWKIFIETNFLLYIVGL